MPLSRDEVLHVASIYRIGLTEEELTRLQGELSDILEQFDVLRELDTEGVPPSAHSLQLSTVMREDVPRESFPQDDVLAGAPLRNDQFFQVPPVLEEE
jgi:aspartyl-tRNA(Asn)/glutamyl-tRNA(Gln) amidotransferase subunit C